jgi:transcriptional regulator with GAF, ATPase, and Fis domain
LIAATNRNLAEWAQNGSFRQDLYFRLSVFPIHLPPLRKRVDDIPLLTQAFIREFEKKMGKRIESIPKKTMKGLQRYPWPGNVRELRNIVERAFIVASGNQLDLEMPQLPEATLLPTLKNAEHQHIVSVLEKTGWRVKGPAGAAELLGMKPTTLYTTMQRLGIPSKHKKYDIPA